MLKMPSRVKLLMSHLFHGKISGKGDLNGGELAIAKELPLQITGGCSDC
jgi:hypothetical protein